MSLVRNQLIAHISTAIAAGTLPPAAGSIVRLFGAETTWLQTDSALRIAGTAAVIGEPDGPGNGQTGIHYLFRNAASLGGGSTEMARNIISERVLGMPREYAADRDSPFDQVPRGR